ncbi:MULTISPECIES: sugar kinase [Chryseobacterium]|uniref:2-dehydro-3-deoxygluconokinase n=1 Tax=Chryseobacterium camelliae TaxID=1265445 RepID=A0ABU0TGX0_9FLAO|nr:MULTISPECIES: sugar kinase [Chryseobacterium]MDT3406135.1 2-dehydro-3-deoxygluconokinase [Pseudacidovorax intermedius]MDQ1096061.1 2-dehydro-3-deoxygluconokinase [Chryseobacterium camelliae]MDQ1099998.1 2-dehydro-3-deoxygluconokinase [Chryseobacterium sp. SORGH_AS_1048]MDR6087343.1 2-dehydro-3-deoxygluconokinase [Chryseobacterium sp. SORGH_AS_0909]MDR6131718.1 2-dehydro-3-deoxygluconokinase [Chryseobacterium sp. SORGH_AS_1175]
MDSGKVLCFGELLLHFAPDLGGNWLGEQSLKIFVGGAEYNVASALAQWHHPVKLLSALPENFVGKQLESKLQDQKIEVLAEKSSGRLGTFYLSSDGDMQHAQVIYDRFPSVFTASDFSSYSPEEVFSGVQWLHISTITPALSEKAHQKCVELMKEAASRKIKVSLDLNYRAALWQGKNPSASIKELMPFVNVLMGNIWSIQQFLEIPVVYELDGTFNDQNLLRQAEQSAAEIQHAYPNVEIIANTFRFTQGDEVNYYATLYADQQLFVSEQYYSEKVEERVGSGDSFMAALIHGILKRNSTPKILEDATKVAFLKLFVKGDTINETINIEQL